MLLSVWIFWGFWYESMGEDFCIQELYSTYRLLSSFYIWKCLTFTNRKSFEECKKSLWYTKSRCRWHTMFEHFYELIVCHLCLIISCISQCLLVFESFELIDWIIELTISISYLTSRYDDMEPFCDFRVIWTWFGKWAREFWFIDEKCWTCNSFSDWFPEIVDQSWSISCFIMSSDLMEFCYHFLFSRNKYIDTSTIFDERLIA